VEAAEAETFVREAHRAVGISLAGGDRVAHAGDQHVAHPDFADDALRGAVGEHDVDARLRRASVADPQLDLLVARGGRLARRAFAVVEAPGAALIGRHGARQRDADGVIARSEIALAFAVALAALQQLAGAVDAQPLDHVARPAAALALKR